MYVLIELKLNIKVYLISLKNAGKLSLSCDNSDKIEPNLIFLLKA